MFNVFKRTQPLSAVTRCAAGRLFLDISEGRQGGALEASADWLDCSASFLRSVRTHQVVPRVPGGDQTAELNSERKSLVLMAVLQVARRPRRCMVMNRKSSRDRPGVSTSQCKNTGKSASHVFCEMELGSSHSIKNAA